MFEGRRTSPQAAKHASSIGFHIGLGRRIRCNVVDVGMLDSLPDGHAFDGIESEHFLAEIEEVGSELVFRADDLLCERSDRHASSVECSDKTLQNDRLTFNGFMSRTYL